MSLVTGTPVGNLDTQETLFSSLAPTIFIQDNTASPLFNPDSDNFYYGLSGTSVYPVYEIGCVSDVVLSSNLTINDVMCDNVGVKDSVQQLNYLEVTFTLKSLFPFSTLTKLISGGAVTLNAGDHTEKFGVGKINNQQFWMVWMPVVYDESAGDYFAVHFHKAKFVDPWTWNFPFGDTSTITGLKLRAFADTSKPSAQTFATVLRSDISAL